MKSAASRKSGLDKMSKRSVWALVGIAAVFMLIGGWLFISASQAEEITDDSTVDDRVQELTFGTAPADLQSAIINYTKEITPGCVQNNQIVDYYGVAIDLPVTYTENGFAATSIGCDDVSELLLAYNNGAWQKVGITQFEYQCKDLNTHKVPTWFLQALVPDDEDDDGNIAAPEIYCIPEDTSATSSQLYTFETS